MTISLLPELLRGLDWIAAEEGRSRSGQIAWMIKLAIRQKKLQKKLAGP